MRVFSLNAKQGDPRYLQVAQGNYWFWQRGYDVIGFEPSQLSAGELDAALIGDTQNTIVFGSVAVVRDAVVRAGRPSPPSLDFPSCLEEFFGRRVFESTMGEVRAWEASQPDRLPVHIKPRDRPKLFAGKVVAAYRDLISLSGVPPEEPVIVQEVIRLATEWRASILRGKVLNIAHYKGNPLVFPDVTVIRDAIKRFVSPPIGYAMDWAVTEEGRTLLIEINDGYALGNYGVRGHHYTALIECRWRELMGLEDNGVGMEW